MISLRENKELFLLAAVVLVLVFAAYSNHFHNAFVFDDLHTIVNNIYIRNISNIPLFFKDATTFSSVPTNQTYRPLLSVTLAIDYYLAKGLDNTFFFHLTSFIFFILQGFLMFLFFLKIFDHADKNPANPFIAIITVAWYMLHPAGAETVNYIIQRGELMSAFFIIFAFVIFMYSPFARKRHLYLIPFALGALAKPMAGVFAPLLFVYLLFFEKSSAAATPKKKRNSKKKARLAAEEAKALDWGHALKNALPAIIFVLAVMLFMQRMNAPTIDTGGGAMFNYVITQPYVMLLYFTTLFLPINLSVDPDLYPFATVADIRCIAGMAFLILFISTAVIALRNKKFRPLSFGIFWFLISLLPTSLIPLGEVMNGHRMFLPFIGLTLGIGWSLSLGIRKLLNSSKSPSVVMSTATALIAIVLLAYAYGTHQRNKVWKTPETLWKDVTVKSPGNARGLMNYGVELFGKADFEGAEKYFLMAFEHWPLYNALHANIARLNEETGNFEEAEKYFLSAIELNWQAPDAYLLYGNFLFNRGRFEEAEESLRRAIQLSPAHIQARQILKLVYFQQEDYQKLSDLAEDTLRIVPNDENASYFLGIARAGGSDFLPDENRTPEDLLHLSSLYFMSNEYEKGIEALLEALELRPFYDLAYIYLCAAYANMEEWDKAVEAGERAVALAPDNEVARNNLDVARIKQAEIRGQTQ